MLVLNDKVTQGFIAGIAGGIVMNLISLISYQLHIANLRFLDWPAIIINGNTPNTTLEVGFALLVQLIFVGVLGIIFTYLISKLITSTNYLFKGGLFGVLSWFVIYALTYVATVPKLTPLTMGTAITDFIGAVAFGLVLAETLNRLDNRVGSKEL